MTVGSVGRSLVVAIAALAGIALFNGLPLTSVNSEEPEYPRDMSGYSAPGPESLARSFDPATIIEKVQGNRGLSGYVRSGDWADEMPPELSIGFEVGGTPRLGVSSVQTAAAVGFDGTNYLVVWNDVRGYEYDIYGARVDKSGDLVDSLGFVICEAYGRQIMPRIAFDGDNYLVVWSDWRWLDDNDRDIYGARVSPSGEVLDPEGIMICAAGGDQYYPSVAFNGSDYLVVWRDMRRNDIYGARLNKSGEVLDKYGIQVCIEGGGQYNTAVAGADGSWMVVWEDGRKGNSADRDIYGTRVTGEGAILDGAGIAISTAVDDQRTPEIAFAGDQFMVVWKDERLTRTADGDIYAARVTVDRRVLDKEGFPVSLAADSQSEPAIAFDGTDYIVTWTDNRKWEDESIRQIYGTTVTTSGVVRDPEGVIISTGTRYANGSAVYAGATEPFVVWTSFAVSPCSIQGTRIGPQLESLDAGGLTISYTINHQYIPRVAYDGTNYLVVWIDTRNDFYDVYGTRVTPSGEILDPMGIGIAVAEGNQQYPDVAFDGVNYLVVWEDYRTTGDPSLPSRYSIYGARITPGGALIDEEGILISNAHDVRGTPAVASAGSGFLVVWRDSRDYIKQIYGCRIDEFGTVLDPDGFLISKGGSWRGDPDIAFYGENFLVVWEDDRADPGDDIYGARVTPLGEVLDPEGLVIGDSHERTFNPAVAAGKENCLVVWYDNRAGGDDYDIYGARVSFEGAVLDPGAFAVSVAERKQENPSVAFDGSDYMVLWEDSRQRSWNIYGTRVSSLGEIIDPEGLILTDEWDSQWAPDLALGEGGQMLIAYPFWVPDPSRRASRIYGNLWNRIDSSAPALALSISHDPELTSEIDVCLASSEALQDSSVEISVNGRGLSVSASDSAARVYRCRYELTASGTHTVGARACDLNGNSADTTIAFAAGHISAAGGGEVRGPAGLVSLSCGPGSLGADCFLLILPGGVASVDVSRCGFPVGCRIGTGVGSVFKLSPAELTLDRPARLAVKTGNEQGRPAFVRLGMDGWEDVESSYDEDSGVLSALVRRLGTYGISWNSSGGPVRLQLRNFPNPFRSSVGLAYHLPAGGDVRIAVYDATGRLVKIIFEGTRPPGWNMESWDGRDDDSSRLPDGVYIATIESEYGVVSRKCVLVK